MITQDIERLIWAVKNGDWSLANNIAKILDPTASGELLAALKLLLADVENVVDYGMPFENPNHGFHTSVTAARAAIAKAEG